MLKAAIAAGKHVFCEKPVAVNAPGVRSVLETTEEAHKKEFGDRLGIVLPLRSTKTGTDLGLHDGAVGDIVTLQVSYNTGTLWHHGRQPVWSEMEYQLRNWLYFTWLSGDFNVEQHVHSLDKAAWAMHDEPPLTHQAGRCASAGDEQWVRNIDHHFSVVYEYKNGVRLLPSAGRWGRAATLTFRTTCLAPRARPR